MSCYVLKLHDINKKTKPKMDIKMANGYCVKHGTNRVQIAAKALAFHLH